MRLQKYVFIFERDTKRVDFSALRLKNKTNPFNVIDAYMKRIIRQRIKDGQAIEEVWIKDGSELKLLYKKFEE